MTRGRKITKKCKQCNNTFEALMIKVKQNKGLFCSQACYHEHRKQNAKDSSHLNRMHQKKHKYGLTESEYLGMFDSQNNLCAICESSFDKVRACVDHSHETGEIRGLLCDRCNKGLGMFKDSQELLTKAIAYLKLPDVPSQAYILDIRSGC